MRRFAIFSLVFVGFASLSAGLTWQTGSFEDALAAARTAGKPLLLDFFKEVG
jgi:hypothetical protein